MKKSVCLGLLPLALAGLSCHAQQNPEIDRYIYSLKYDSRALLSLPADGSTASLPARESGPRSVIICTSMKKGLSKEFNEVTVLDPAAGIVYPGALVRADRKLAEGKPTAISLPRAPVTVSVDLPGLRKKGARRVEPFSHSAYQEALNTILEEWNAQSVAEGYVNAARSSLKIEKADSASQLALNLGFSAAWMGNNIASNLEVSHSNKSSSTVALFRQVFYTVTADLPQYPSDVFAEGVTAAQLAEQGLNASSPPGYVKSVDYGRLIFVRMDTREVNNKSDLKAALNYVTSGDKKIDANTRTRYESIINNSTFTVVTIGGNAETASRMFQPGEINQLREVIRANSVYARSNPGVPIAYTVAFLKHNEIAAIRSATEFMDTDCTTYPNGFVRLKHSGGYVAKFTVDWNEKDEKGKPVHKEWSSGNQTAGWTQTLDLPGDASGVRIRGWAKTGLVWSPWGEILNVTENGPSNKCYRARGTTLNRSWDNDC